MTTIKRFICRILNALGHTLHDAGVTLMFIGWEGERFRHNAPTHRAPNKTDPNIWN